ncbi:hypothetical protein [Janthinobacterium sp. 64]|uniref:hypothetical protein n=1 Tax=Janthinobacterium sp. 64 TaxID=2035208 RepID=UPI000CC260C4|nr:hypothetical protein [Janthinobacterium sp. 64]PKB24405.1 hypothetical protein CLU91_4893 [Janthinobacterium sp. 64]
MKALFFTTLATIFVAPAQAEVVVHPIVAGSSSARLYGGADYCKDFFIMRIADGWSVVQEGEADLKNDKFEKLQGCLGKTDNDTVDVVVFSAAVMDKCTTYTQCVPPILGNGACVNRTSYRHRTSRYDGYFACNSNFANRKGMLNGLQFDAPIDNNLLASALSSNAIKAASTEFAQAQYSRILASIEQVDTAKCGSCQLERDAIINFFNNFSNYTNPEKLITAGRDYINITGIRQLPSWMMARISPVTAEMLIAQGGQDWRQKYVARIKQLMASDANMKDIESFIKQLENSSNDNWSSVDFDGKLPQFKELLRNRMNEENRLAKKRTQDAAQEAERQRQAEAKKVLAWRKTLQVGSDTFCGPVIEIRHPMVKIFISVQLQGFGNEAWLKSSDIFPPEYGCRNVNGRLSTY